MIEMFPDLCYNQVYQREKEQKLMGRKPRIEDICARLGLSKATVSKALNGYASVREETRVRVLDCARELGYTQSPGGDVNARLIRVGITAAVAIDDPGRISPFQLLLNNLIDGLTQKHYDTIMLPPSLLQEQSVPYEQAMRNQNLDCAFLTGLRTDDPYYSQLQVTELPTVLWDMSIPNPHVCNVCSDSVEGMRMAAAHLIALGHRRIGLIAGHRWAQVSQYRTDGYILALADAGIPYDPSLVYEGDFSETAGAIGLQVLLARKVTAILCVCDVTALGVIRAASAQGIRIPDDLSVVGYDNINLAEYIGPGLTSVDQHLDEVGRIIVTTICNMMHHLPVGDTFVHPSLVIRGSTAAPARSDE